LTLENQNINIKRIAHRGEKSTQKTLTNLLEMFIFIKNLLRGANMEKNVTVKVDSNLWNEFKSLAYKQGLTLKDAIKEAIILYLEFVDDSQNSNKGGGKC
jgi:predicted DNA binding CopG/RHH family protein